MLTASQKLAACCLPVAALLLAVSTSGEDWSYPREQRSWRRTMHPAPAKGEAPAEEPGKAAGEGAGKEPAPAKKEAGKPPAGVTPSKPPAKETGGGKAPAKEPPAAEKPAAKTPEAPKEIPFRVAGLEVVRNAGPLTDPAAGRLDLQVGASGAVKIGNDFSDLATALEAIGGHADPAGTLLFLVPHSRAPWDAVRDLAAGGAAGGWKRIALAAAATGDPGQARVVTVDPAPAGGPPGGAVPATTVKVLAGSAGTPSFEVMGDVHEGRKALVEVLRELHGEYEGFAPGYANEIGKTPWTVDGSGATAGGVLQALDALAAAGVKKVRLAGVTLPE